MISVYFSDVPFFEDLMNFDKLKCLWYHFFAEKKITFKIFIFSINEGINSDYA